MVNENISLILVYEPSTVKGRPMPLARIGDPQLILAVAEHAISDAISRVTVLSQSDEVLGELERAEVDRLRAVLAALIPELWNRINQICAPSCSKRRHHEIDSGFAPPVSKIRSATK